MQLEWFSMYNLYHYMSLKQRDEREPLSDGAMFVYVATMFSASGV